MFGCSTKKYIRNSEKYASYVNFINLAKLFSAISLKKAFLAKNSVKWAKNGQLTLEIALMKDDTCVLSIMRQKLDEKAKKPSKNGSKGKKIPQNWPKFRPLVNFRSQFRGLVLVRLTQIWS